MEHSIKKKALTSYLLISLLVSTIIQTHSIAEQNAYAAELSHTFVEQFVGPSTFSTTYEDITNAYITSGNFTEGKKYLLIFAADMGGSSLARDPYIMAVHGTTGFEGSELAFEPMSNTVYYTYFWYTVWTAVAGEGVKLQYKTEDSAEFAQVITPTLTSIKLSDDLTENTDWFFNENATDTTLRASYGTTGNATITFTPNGTDDWLILATAQLDPTSITVPQKTRIDANGGVTDSGVEWIQEGEDATADRMVHTLAKVYTPTSTSTTFQTETESSSVSGSRLYNSIFALNLNKFSTHSFNATQAELAIDTTNNFATSTNTATTSVTPTVTGDFWALGFGVLDVAATGEYIIYGLTVDGTVQPPAGSFAKNNIASISAWDATDELPIVVNTIENINTNTHTLKLNATKATNARPVEDRLVMWVSMELASTATKFYLRAGTTPNSPTNGERSTALPVGTFTGNSGDGFENLSLSTTKGTSQTSKAISSLLQLTHQDMYAARFSSPSLAAQTISAGTYTLAAATSESAADAEAFTVGSIYVYRPSTSATVGYVYDSDTALGAEYSTSEDGQVYSLSGSSVTTQAGDILVLEFWVHATQLIGLGRTNTLYFDGATDVVDSTTTDAASYLSVPQALTFSTNCDGCNTTIQQNQGWIFAIMGIYKQIIHSLFPTEQKAEAQIQQPISLSFKIVPQFTTTGPESQVRNLFNNQIISKLETAINNRLQSEFSNYNIKLELNLYKQGTNYVVYPKVVISGTTQSQLDTLLQKYDMAVDDILTSMLTDLNNAGINNIKWHIHKSFGGIDIK